MRLLTLNTDYAEFLLWLYTQHPGLERLPHEEQMRARNDSLFGVADFYSYNLRELGHEAYDVYARNEWMQRAWAREHGVEVPERSIAGQRRWRALQRVRQAAARLRPLHFKPLLRRAVWALDRRREAGFYAILAAQIKHYRPDVLLNQDMSGISPQFLREMKPYVRLLVGHHSATRLSDIQDYRCYDLVISSFPPTVAYFKHRGIPSESVRLGFEARVLPWLKDGETPFPVTFVGSFHEVHRSRVTFLERLCALCDEIQVWGPGIEHLPAASPLRRRYAGQAWGRDMYQILHSSRITLNHHGDVPPLYANNLRLYEATGVGALLLTDWKEDLGGLFEPGKEVVAYRTPEECAELVRYYLEHEEERQAIARAGQQRTLGEHTYRKRMQELVELVGRYL